jgi:transcriptional regulator with XRE-family HTH domain
MQSISAKQIRMARAYQDWSREDLAQETGLSVNTIRNLESSFSARRDKTTAQIRSVFEREGLEFTTNNGIRQRIDDLVYLAEPDCCETFFDDVLQIAKRDANGIMIFVPSQEMLARCCGGTSKNDLSRIEELSRYTSLRCLLPDTENVRIEIPMIDVRFIAREEVISEPHFIYGNNWAIIHDDGGSAFRFIIFRFAKMAYNRKTDFRTLWERASIHPRHPRQ